MKRAKFFAVCAIVSMIALPVSAQSVSITGAGASFPYPLYSQWGFVYNSLTKVQLNYQSIGSGGGIAQIKAQTVDFGASDAPLTPMELESAGLFQFPMIVGGVVAVVNIEGIKAGTLRLTPQALAGIFLGTITYWDDTSLVHLNPGLKLPHKAITVVHRADGSGTTWIFTNYLDKVSPEWHNKVGMGKAVEWPVGIGGKGNEGVASYVQTMAGSIGYVEYAYALQNKMIHTLLQNRAGEFVQPTIKTFQAATASADWTNAPGFYLVLTDQPGKESWPITGASFILMHRDQPDKEKARQILAFFDWCYRHGTETAQKLDYVPLPTHVIALVEDAWKTNITSTGKPVWP